MNEETTPNSQPEKSGLDENRKNALLRYIAIMFVVALVFFLLSMLNELRSSEATISELNQSSASALQKAEQLQDTNRQLETDNAFYQGQIEELEERLQDLQDQLEETQEKHDRQMDELEALLEQAEEDQSQIRQAYDLLLEAQALAQEEDESLPEVLKELEEYKQYLGKSAMKTYENLIKEGE